MSLYEVLKASKTERFPDYWTLLWGRKMSASMIKTLTGVLPLTFTAKGGTAVDWVIEGNNDVGENLFDIFVKSVTSTNDYYAEASIADASITTDDMVSYFNQHIGDTFSFAFDVITEYSGSIQKNVVFYFTDNTVSAFRGDFTITKAIWRIGVRARFDNPAGRGLNYTFNHIMIVKGSTAPDHYIPYQQGVGERTENLVPPIRTANGWKQGYRNYINGDYVPAYASGEWLYDVYIPINSASFTFWAANVSNPSSTFYFYDSDKQYLPNAAKGTNNYNNVIISNISPDAAYMQFAFRTYCMSEQEVIDNNYQVMLVKGSTPPETFIPYGYQIPTTVSQQGQPDKTVDIYIGDSPLTEGETVSKTSTGVDIELFEGENVVSTTLYNKPALKIKYK